MIDTPSLKEAAIILKSLPQEQAALILARLDPKSQRKLHSTMALSGDFSASEVNEAAERLFEDSGEEYHIAGGATEAEKSERWRGEHYYIERRSPTSQNVDPPKGAERRRKRERRRAVGPFEFLKQLDEDLVVRLLEAEHPKNVAQVLLTLDPSFASSIMRQFEMPMRVSVMRRLCEVEEIDQVSLIELRYDLKMRANKVGLIQQYTRKGVDVASDLLSLTDERTRRSLFAYMNQTDPELKDILELKTVSIHDIGRLSDDEVKSLLRRVDTTAWAPALRTTTLSDQQKVVKNMAPAAAAILTSEMACYDPLDEAGMMKASKVIIKVILDLKKVGRITSLREPDSEDIAQ